MLISRGRAWHGEGKGKQRGNGSRQTGRQGVEREERVKEGDALMNG